MANIFLARQDLATYPQENLDILARYYKVKEKGEDLLWVLAYKIHGKQHSTMPRNLTQRLRENPEGVISELDTLQADEINEILEELAEIKGEKAKRAYEIVYKILVNNYMPTHVPTPPEHIKWTGEFSKNLPLLAKTFELPYPALYALEKKWRS